MSQKIKIEGEMASVLLVEQPPEAWSATGEFRGKQIETVGPSEQKALDLWIEEARAVWPEQESEMPSEGKLPLTPPLPHDHGYPPVTQMQPIEENECGDPVDDEMKRQSGVSTRRDHDRGPDDPSS